MIEFIKKHTGLIILAIALVSFDVFSKELFFTQLLIYGLFIKLLLSDRLSDKRRKILFVMIWSAFVVIGGLTAYVNWYLPHGPLIDTGDITCANDGRGPCGESYIEDTRGLNIPDWAKFLRTSEAELIILGLALAGILANKRPDENES